MVPLPQMQQPFPTVQADQMFRWNNGVEGNGFVDTGSPALNSFAMMPTPSPYGQPVAAPSTALARRQNSRALVPSGARSAFDHSPDSWGGYSDEPGYLQAANSSLDEHDNIERLEEMAQRAKREAQAKRKQIPPFVQKLSRYAAIPPPPPFSCPTGALTNMQLLGRVEKHRSYPLVRQG